jgi:hypothetical protein
MCFLKYERILVERFRRLSMIRMEKQEAVKMVTKVAAIIFAREGSIDQAVANAVEILKGAEEAVEAELAKKDKKEEKKR